MEDKKIFRIILDAMMDCEKNKSRIEGYGEMIFNLYTEKGLPFEIAIDEIGKKVKFSLNEKIVVLAEYQDLMMKHNLKSGLTEKRQKAMQEKNKKDILKLFNDKDFNY